MENPVDPKKVVISSKPTGTANWKIKLHEILRYPTRRIVPAAIVSTVIYVTLYNLGVRWWKGENHPVNRFMWRIQEQNGTLDPMLQAKKRAVLSYQEDRFYRARDVEPNLGI